LQIDADEPTIDDDFTYKGALLWKFTILSLVKLASSNCIQTEL